MLLFLSLRNCWYIQTSTNSTYSLVTFNSWHFWQSAHPVALFFLYCFRVAAIAVYLLCGFFTSNYVLSVSCHLDLNYYMCLCTRL